MARDVLIPEERAHDSAAALLQNDPKLRRLSKRILRHQRLLRRALTPEGWLVYLRLEALVNERQFELLERMAPERHARLATRAPE